MRFKKQKNEPPKGILRGSFEQLFNAGCIQVGGDLPELGLDAAESKFSKVFVLLMQETRYNPCNGCPAYKGGSCKAFQRYFERQDEHRRKHPKVSRVRYQPAKRCVECGLKIRGTEESHVEGEQHKRRMAAMKGK